MITNLILRDFNDIDPVCPVRNNIIHIIIN